MKEFTKFTIEQKAKAYDKAIKLARDYYEDKNCFEYLKGVLENIFPEFTESEDELIRKEIISHLRHEYVVKRYVSDVEYDKWIAWLEKQGNVNALIQEAAKKSYTEGMRVERKRWIEKQYESIKIKKGKNYLCTKTHKYAGIEWIEGVKYYSPEDYSLVNQGCTYYCPKYSKEEHNNFFKEVEYDGCLEVDKVEPKFKVGDWIVSSVLGTAHIIGVNDSNEYQLEYIDGKQEFSSIDYVNYEYDEWTIKDAKPCDVLVSKHNQPFIYNGIFDEEHVGAYCGIDKLGNDFLKANFSCAWSSKEGVKPATKEQRDALFTKMKEAGYGFDLGAYLALPFSKSLSLDFDVRIPLAPGHIYKKSTSIQYSINKQQ